MRALNAPQGPLAKFGKGGGLGFRTEHRCRKGRSGFAGIVQGEKGLSRAAGHDRDGRDPYGEGSFPAPKPLAEEVAS